jgi:hypothetical protein
VLRDDGTVWLNIGDSYGDNRQLVGIPARVALALQADGWAWCAAMPWIKRNAFPDSGTTRPGKATEDVFLFSKTGDHFFDMEAVKVAGAKRPGGGAMFGKPGGGGQQYRRYERPVYRHRAWRSGDLWIAESDLSDEEIAGFDVPVASFNGSHKATFSTRLITPMILSSTSACGACAECGAPYRPVVKSEIVHIRNVENGERAQWDRANIEDIRNGGWGFGSCGNQGLRDGFKEMVTSTVAWRKGCGCATESIVPCTVLDPFVGSGTVVATALQHGRAGIGIDLSEEYLRDHAVTRIEAALKGEKVQRKQNVVPHVPPPPPPAIDTD